MTDITEEERRAAAERLLKELEKGWRSGEEKGWSDWDEVEKQLGLDREQP